MAVMTSGLERARTLRGCPGRIALFDQMRAVALPVREGMRRVRRWPTSWIVQGHYRRTAEEFPKLSAKAAVRRGPSGRAYPGLLRERARLAAGIE